MSKLASNDSASQSTPSNGQQEQQREPHLIRKLKDTQSGSLSLSKQRLNRAAMPTEVLDLEPSKGRDSWPSAKTMPDQLQEQPSGGRSRGKRNAGTIYQLASSLKPSSLSTSNSNGSASNGNGIMKITAGSQTVANNNEHDQQDNNNKKLSNNRPDSSQTNKRQQTGGANETRPTMSRQRFAAASKDLADLSGVFDETETGANPRQVSMATTRAEHLVREANAFQQINPEDELSFSLPVAPPSASNFIQQHAMAHQPAIQSPSPATVSDATTADSLAMEALEYLADELEDNEELLAGPAATTSNPSTSRFSEQLGGALEALSFDEEEAETNMQHLAAPQSVGKGLNSRVPDSQSTHSALTQTGSRDMGEL